MKSDDLNDGGLAAAAAAEPEVDILTADLVITKHPDAMTQDEVDRLRAVAGDQSRMVGEALAIVVTNAEEEQTAVEFLAQLRQQRRATEEARLFLTRPLRAHVESIIAKFKPHEESLDTAVGLVTTKVTDYRAEIRRRAEEEQRRAEEERRAREEQLLREAEEREAKAREERERAEAEARRREQEAADRARAAAEAQARVAEGLRAEMAALPATALRYQSLHGDSDDRRSAASAELNRRAAAEEAETAERERLEAEQRQRDAEAAERAARTAEIPHLPAVHVPQPPRTTRSATGSATSRGVWKHEVTDFMALVRAVAAGEAPREFLQVSPELGKAVRRANQPVRDVPGVRIWQDASLSVRTNG